MILSKNFRLEEFTYSEAAEAHGLTNEPPASVLPALRDLVVDLLQPLCDRTGWHGLVSSGYRSPEVNRLVGGVETSQHVRGEAADMVFYRTINGRAVYARPVEVLRTLLSSGLDFDQAIAYPNFVHLSYTAVRANRRQVLYNRRYTGNRV